MDYKENKHEYSQYITDNVIECIKEWWMASVIVNWTFRDMRFDQMLLIGQDLSYHKMLMKG